MNRRAAPILLALAILGSCDRGKSEKPPVTKEDDSKPDRVAGKAPAKAQTESASAKADETKEAADVDENAADDSTTAAPEDLSPATATAAGNEPSPGPLRFEPVEGPGGKLPYVDKSPPGADEPEEEQLCSMWDFGWTQDSSKFVFCRYDASDEGGECEVRVVGGKGKKFSLAKLKAYEEDNGPIARGAKKWPYSDITITFERKGNVLKIGGRAAKSGGKAAVFKFEFDEEWYSEAEGDVGLGYASVSPNGKHIAVVGAAIMGFVDQEMALGFQTTGEFAASVYGAHGFQSLKSSAYEEAARWFSRAAGASDAWKHPYNEACARARGKLEGTEAALKAAIERGGAKVENKAKRDADLANVKDEAWFKTLVGG